MTRKNKILVTLNGDLDLNSVSEFKRRMDEAIEGHKTDVSIGCGELRYIDSTGLGVRQYFEKSKRIWRHDGNQGSEALSV